MNNTGQYYVFDLWPRNWPKPNLLIPFNEVKGQWVTVTKDGKKFVKWDKNA